MSHLLETVRWSDGKVRILDQRRLPADEVYLDLERLEQVEEAIRTLAVRGAPAIGVAGALGLAQEAGRLAAHAAGEAEDCREELRPCVGDDGKAAYLAAVEAAAERLAAVRPTAVNLRWGLRRVCDDLRARARGPATPAELAEASLAEAQAILEEDLALSRAMAEHGIPLLPPEAKVISHCNTGGLATAGGGTALGVVLEAHARGRKVFVYVDETRPLLQGARLTAWELQRAGIPYAIQCDGAAAWRMRTAHIDCVLVGADRIASNGDTANKVGTLSVAIAAREFGVPFYVVAPRSSFDLSLPDGEAIPIEQRDGEEVLRFGGQPVAPDQGSAWNPAFDVTPARLISAWITERGVEQPPFS